MGKKDFTMSTQGVFDSFFTPQSIENNKTEVKEEEIKAEEPKKEEIKAEEPKKEEIKAEEPKTKNKNCRYNFYLDNELSDFINNYLWLTKNRSYSQYFNNLIKQDFLKILGLPLDTSNEKMLEKWEEYKKNNNL